MKNLLSFIFVLVLLGACQPRPASEVQITLQPESLVLISGYKLAMGDKGIAVD